MQLSVKALLHLFTSVSSPASEAEMLTAEPDNDASDTYDDDLLTSGAMDDDDNDNDSDDGDDKEGNASEDITAERDSEAKVDGALEELTEKEHDRLLDDTAAVRATLNKVHFPFVLVHWVDVDTHWLNYEDSQAIICNCPFHYHCTSGLACSVHCQ